MSILKVNQIQVNDSSVITVGSDMTTDNDVIVAAGGNLLCANATSATLPANTTVSTGHTFNSVDLVSTGSHSAEEMNLTNDSRKVSWATARIMGVLQFTATWDQAAANTVAIANLSVLANTSFGVANVSRVALATSIRVDYLTAMETHGQNEYGVVMARLNPGATNPHEDTFGLHTVQTDSSLFITPCLASYHTTGVNKVVTIHFSVMSKPS
tara:strand:- start:933 stop:1568 length:636 start_codon:yes stop_codon:yes gene_type:complete